MDSVNILSILQKIIIMLPGFLLAITVHEYAHGRIALRLGDPTARVAGRLTFNPISHLDPFGTLVLILTAMTGMAIGWAKPVPVDPRYFRNPRQDMVWVSLAGPAANMIAAAALAVLVHGILYFYGGRPVGPTTKLVLQPVLSMLAFGVHINVVLAILNLVPVHPLDGSKILEGILPRDLAYQYGKLEPYGVIIFIGLLISGVLVAVIGPPIGYVKSLLLYGLF
jgi:Zn-dependent protease